MVNYWIYGKDNCVYCEKAKHLLQERGLQYAYIDVGIYPQFRDESWKTVPQIFYVGEYIGGYRALEAFLDAGSE